MGFASKDEGPVVFPVLNHIIFYFLIFKNFLKLVSFFNLIFYAIPCNLCDFSSSARDNENENAESEQLNHHFI